MTKEKQTLKSLNIKPDLFFTGTDEEIEKAEEQETRRNEEIKELVTSTGFLALEYTTAHGQRVILHGSTRPWARFQLSFLDADGIPAGHKSFIETDGSGAAHTAAELWEHFTSLTRNKDLTLTVLRK